MPLIIFYKRKESKYINYGFELMNSLKRDGIIRGTSLVSLNSRSTNNLIVLEKSTLCMSFDRVHQTPYPNSLMGSIALINNLIMIYFGMKIIKRF